MTTTPLDLATAIVRSCVFHPKSCRLSASAVATGAHQVTFCVGCSHAHSLTRHANPGGVWSSVLANGPSVQTAYELGWTTLNRVLLAYTLKIPQVPIVVLNWGEYYGSTHMVPQWLATFLTLGTELRRQIPAAVRTWDWPDVLARAVKDEAFRDCLESLVDLGTPGEGIAAWVRAQGSWPVPRKGRRPSRARK